MTCQTLKVFEVGNGDCLLLEMLDQEFGAVDFCRLDSIPDHPLCSRDLRESPKAIFACLTHPHHDHIGNIEEMEKALEFVAENGGRFWHTVADMAEVLRLYGKVVLTSRGRLLIDELRRLARLATMVSEKFPRNRIHFVSSDTEIDSPFASPKIDFDVLGPSRAEALNYIHMLRRVANGEIETINDRIINRTSAVLLIRYGENTIVLGGDAPAQSWKRITGRSEHDSPQPMRIQATKASHHGSDDSFYDELWDDLFGNNAGIVLVSANGSTRPTKAFLESFQPRRDRGINDKICCTGPIDPQRRPEFLALEYQAVLDWAARRGRGFGTVTWGTIEVTIPPTDSITVSQPYVTPV